MKIITYLLILIGTSSSHSNSTSNDFSKHSGKIKTLSVDRLRKRLEVTGTLYVMDPAGEILFYEGQETREWSFSSKGDLSNYWSYSSDQIQEIALYHNWTLDEKGRINAHIQQYDSMKRNANINKNPMLGKLLREKKILIKNFEPVTWEVRSSSKRKILIQFGFKLKRLQEPSELGKVPISAKNAILTDNKDFVWAPDVTFSGQYISMMTNKGSIHISYQPFKGAKKIGYGKGHILHIDITKKHSLKLLSSTPFVPFGVHATVYGLINLERKSKPRSVSIHSGNKEKEFLSTIK